MRLRCGVYGSVPRVKGSEAWVLSGLQESLGVQLFGLGGV